MRAISLRHSAFAVVLGALLGAAEARANPLDMYGFGPRGASLAGAVGADVSDVYAAYYNPAGLARLRGLRIDLGYQYASPRLRTDGRDNDVDPSRGVIGGIAAPGRVFGVPFAVGVAFHIPDERLSQVRTPLQSQPRWELYGVRLQRLYIAAALAISPVRWLRLAGGVAFMASTSGGVEVSGRISATNPSTTALTHAVDADLTAVRYAQFGAQADLGRGVSLGVTFRDEFRLDVGLDASLRGQITVGPADNPRSLAIPGAYALRSRTITAFQPRQVAMSAAWQITRRWRAGVDLTWNQWSRYEDPTAALDVSLDLDIPAGLGVARPVVPAPTARVALRFHDTLTPRVGISYDAPVGPHTIALRAGYFWDPSPVPEQTGATTLIDCDRHVVSLGVGATLRRLGAVLPGSLSIDAFAAVQLLTDRPTRKLDPTDPTGDFVASGYALSTGVNLAVGFE